MKMKGQMWWTKYFIPREGVLSVGRIKGLYSGALRTSKTAAYSSGTWWRETTSANPEQGLTQQVAFAAEWYICERAATRDPAAKGYSLRNLYHTDKTTFSTDNPRQTQQYSCKDQIQINGMLPTAGPTEATTKQFRNNMSYMPLNFMKKFT